MCLAIPLTIEEIQDKTAVASANGISQKIRLIFYRIYKLVMKFWYMLDLR